MARYNEWMNSRLYALCATSSLAELHADRGALFKSVYATLNHIAYSDVAFLARFTGEPAVVPRARRRPVRRLRRAGEREAVDARLIAWSETLMSEWPAETLTYPSKVDGATRTRPRWLLVAHLFNHQTHHRGHVTALLTQQRHDVEHRPAVHAGPVTPWRRAPPRWLSSRCAAKERGSRRGCSASR